MERQSTDDPSEARVLDGTSWAEFCDTLKRAGDVLLDPRAPANAFDRAEGLRYLTRLTRAALETFVEDADPAAPELLRTCHETIKMGADNPDNYYQNAPVSGKYEYVIRGKRGSVHYLGFGTQEGNYGATGSLKTVGYLDDSSLIVEPDGSFEIAVSGEPRPGNWLKMTPDTRTLVVRQTFLDRSLESRAELRLERVDGAHAPRPVSPRAVDRGLVASARFVTGCAKLFHEWAAGLAAHPNTLPRFDPKVAEDAGGVPHIAYFHGYYEIPKDHALVIDVTPPDCDYWNFQINNHWMESLDYRYFQVTVNKSSAKLRADESVRLILSARDPGVDNWIDTVGHERGTMCLRWVRAKEHPLPSCKLVRIDELLPFTSESMILEASKRAGMDDFGSNDFRSSLDALVEFYEHRLLPAGKRGERRRLVGLLQNRLRINKALRDSPQILERKIEAPLFLTGMPRTGTSALFNLLAADPASRPLLLWEGNHPDPLNLPPGTEDPRLVALRAGLEKARLANPEFAKIHDARADAPEECVQLLAHSMGFVQLGVEPVLEPYRSFFASADFGPAYRYYADLLRLLDSQRPGKRWLLKTPAHLWALDHLEALFPDAGIVITHRDPLECVPSYCSMVQALMRAYVPVPSAELGPLVLDYLARSVERAESARKANPNARIVDVRYADFIEDPLEVARGIHTAFALPFEGAVQQSMRAHIEANPRNKHGSHDYDLERFGLTEKAVLDRLGDYIKRYRVPTRAG